MNMLTPLVEREPEICPLSEAQNKISACLSAHVQGRTFRASPRYSDGLSYRCRVCHVEATRLGRKTRREAEREVRAREAHDEFMRPSAFGNAASLPQELLQVEDLVGIADIDVHAAGRSGVAATESPVSLPSQAPVCQ